MIPKREVVIVSATKIIDIKIYKEQTILALLIMVSLAETVVVGMVVETGAGMMTEETAAADAVDQGAAAEAMIAGVEAPVLITDVVVAVVQILVNASIPPAILVHVQILVTCLLRNHTVINP